MNAIEALASIAFLATTWIVCAGLVSSLSHLAWPVFERRLGVRSPHIRARRLTAFASAPTSIPTLLLGLCLLPGVAGFVTGRGDHCPAHLDHAHLCLFHGTTPLSPLLIAGLLVVFALLIAILRHGIRCIVLARHESRGLDEAVETRLASGAFLTRSPMPFARTGGWIRARIWLSTALYDALSPAQRDVVIAHERAHAERRDPLRGALASSLARLHVPSTRRALLAALRLATEQDCDERAAEATGDRLGVAETLLVVERLVQEHTRTGASSLAVHAGILGSTVPQRVRSLLGDAPETPKERSILRLCVAGAVLLGFGAEAIHHGVEHLLEILATGLPRAG